MKCPYCQAELEGCAHEYGDYHENLYGSDEYWDEFRCKCPHCGEEFRWFENYVRIGDSALRMDE